MMNFSLLAIFIIFSVIFPLRKCSPELEKVTIPQGTIQGISLDSRRGRTYYGYLGIPYGHVPKRFSVPEKAGPWQGILDGRKHPPMCFQYFVFTHEMMGVEQCLFLNVYSPKPKKGEKLPVFVFMYPGGFQIGGASLFEAKYLMDNDVVYVALNYRLGALGFLNTGEGSVTGNMGLKDQVLALEWIRDNIGHFGGDPDLVTIFGISAGGASVDYLSISPLAKGLFHRAISMSGSSLAPWAFQHHPSDLAETFAQNAGCSNEGWEWPVKMKCLREKPVTEIVTAQLKLMKLGFDLDFLHMKFVPSIETEAVKGPRFLTDSPYNLLSQGKIANKVPIMVGHVENEGSFYIAPIMQQEKLVAKINKEWDTIAPHQFYFDDVLPPSRHVKVSKLIRNFYFKDNKPLSKENQRGLSNIYSDRFFCNSVAQQVDLRRKHQPVFPYILDFQGTHSLIQVDFGIKERDGVAHADDMMYIFNQTLGGPDLYIGTKDGDFSENLLKLFVSFAKDGKPTGTWGKETNWPAQRGEGPLTFYKLDLEDTKLLTDPLKKRREFWQSLNLREHQNAGMRDDKDEL